MRRLIEQAYALHRWLLKVLRIETRGVKLLVHDDRGRVLLIRNRYGRDHWLLPGGGVKRGEPPVDAARRELREETGLDAATPRFFARHHSSAEGRRDTIDLFVAVASGEPVADGVEVADACFFAPLALPDTVSPATLRRIGEWQGERDIDSRW